MKKFLKLFLLLSLLAFIGLGANGGCGGCGSPAVDNSAPTVAIVSPQDGKTVGGTVEVKAEATDNVGVVKVEFYIDGNKVGEDNESPYTYNWTIPELDINSTHTIQARAYDSAGNVGYSPIITVYTPKVYTHNGSLEAGYYIPLKFTFRAGTGANIRVTASDDIHFYVFDAANYAKWQAGQTCTYIIKQDNVTSVNQNLVITTAGDYYFVIHNTHTLVTVDYSIIVVYGWF